MNKMPKNPSTLTMGLTDLVATTNVLDGKLVNVTSFIGVDGADAIAKKAFHQAQR